jgi:SAM-dependent methyltransferase
MNVRRRLLRRVIGQFHRPDGASGHVTGWIMAYRLSNRRRNRWVVSLLDVQPTDRVLEIGYGPGIAIQALSRLTTRGAVFGIDHSEVMLRQARRRNAAAIRAGRVDLRCGSVDHLPAFGPPLDKIVAVNSMGFWPDAPTRLRELRTILRAGGQIAVASQPRCPGATQATSAQAAVEIETVLNNAGFCGTRVEILPLDPPVVCVIGERP